MPKVLLVDDSKTIQKVVSLILKGSTYSLFSAENKEEGEKLALQEKPDIILIDSLDLVEAFKKNPQLSDIKLGLLYGNFKKISSELIKELHIDGALAKPFDAREFLKFLEDLIKVTSPVTTNARVLENVPIVTDEFKSLFNEEELENCLDFLEQPTKPAIPPVPLFDDSQPITSSVPITSETIERICKEIIPPLAEQIIREELQKLLNDKND